MSIRGIALVTLLAACGGDAPSPSDDLPCAGGAGGGARLTDRADIAYSVAFSDDSARGETMHIQAVFVGRGTPGWRNRMPNTPVQRPPAQESLSVSGSSLGRMFVGHDPRSNTAWLHEQRVPLDSFNVLLIDRVDSVGGPPIVAARLRIDPDIRLGGMCARRATIAGQGWADSLRAVVMRNATVREFAAGR